MTGAVRSSPTRSILLTALALLLAASQTRAEAAQPPVLDVAGESGTVQVRGAVRYRLALSSVRIVRELACYDDPLLCAGSQGVVAGREIDASTLRHELSVDLRLGLLRGVELRIEAPMVLGDQTGLDYAKGVGPDNTRVGNGLLALPQDGPSRSGLGDMTFGVRLAPLQTDYDGLRPTLVLDLSYTAPTGGGPLAGSANPGSGMHQIGVGVDAGVRALPWLEPYIGLFGLFRLGADSEAFLTGFATQRLEHPGEIIGGRVGAGFTLWEDTFQDAVALLVVEGNARHTGDGRAATVLFDGLGTSPCTEDQSCHLNEHVATGLPTNGVTDEEGHARLGGSVTLVYRPVEVFQLELELGLGYTTGHALTYGEPGMDLDDSGTVDEQNSAGLSELSPLYVPEIDQLGNRLLARGSLELGLGVSMSGRF